MGTELETIHVRQPRQINRDDVSKWESVSPELKRLNDATLDKPRGYVLTKADAIAICGDEAAFKRVVLKWKDCLLWLRGITAEWCHAERGYRFIDTHYHLTVRNQRLLASIEKRHRYEALRIGLIDDGDLGSDHARRLRAMVAQQHSDDAGRASSQREAVRLAMARPETLPRVHQKGN